MEVITSVSTLDELEIIAVKSLKYHFETLKKVSSVEDRLFLYSSMRKVLEV